MPRSPISSPRSWVDRVRALPRPTLPQAGVLVGLSILAVLLGSRILGMFGDLREVRAARTELEAKKEVLETRHTDLEEQVRLVSDPNHLEQELRSRFNYKLPGEQVIVVVPPQETSSDE